MRVGRTSLVVVLSLACAVNSYASDVLFTVVGENGAPLAEFTVPTDANGFASTGRVFSYVPLPA